MEKPRAVLHVGMAKCASTYIGDQALAAARKGTISAKVWQPFDHLIGLCTRAAGIPVEAFSYQTTDFPMNPPTDRPFVGTNECLTGNIPQPMRSVSTSTFRAADIKTIQTSSALALKQVADSALRAFDVRILFVVRDPAPWLHSLYRNVVIMGVGEPADVFFDRFGEVAAQWLDVNYLLELYRAQFGEDRVAVLPMEMLQRETSAFFQAFNELTGADVLVDNEARNVGLSDGAAEHFRKYWEQIDRIAPPLPIWQDRTVTYKQQTWEFLHYAILNDTQAVERANQAWVTDDFRYSMPGELVKHMRSRMTSLQTLPSFEPYLKHYFPEG